MTKLKIASFNVNSVNARLPNILSWLKESSPDIVCLQELKAVEEKFPVEQFLDAGYNSAILGQKTYNGVAILSKYQIDEVFKGLDDDDFQARYIEATILVEDNVVRVSSIYLPNGGGNLEANERLVDSAKFQYKMDFFDKLQAKFQKLLTYDEIQIFAGDYNVAAEEIDVYDPKSLENTVCFHDLERQKFRSLLNLGLVDSFRSFLGSEVQQFSWWDYRGGSWQHNKGMRIDYLLASPAASDKIISASIEDNGVRDQPKASDHCPVIVELEL